MADYATLKVSGQEHVQIYRAYSNPQGSDGQVAELQHHNCGTCGCQLFVYAPIWGEWVYPAASAIDSELPTPPEIFHINLNQKPHWVFVPEGKGHVHFDAVPEESIADFHRRHGIYLD